MTLDEYIAAWNEKYRDSIIAERVHCIHSRCGRRDLIVTGDGIWGQVECPDHGPYWIATPRAG